MVVEVGYLVDISIAIKKMPNGVMVMIYLNMIY
jgi:hypothetical protein